jgi:hypothetical protein
MLSVQLEVNVKSTVLNLKEDTNHTVSNNNLTIEPEFIQSKIIQTISLDLGTEIE